MGKHRQRAVPNANRVDRSAAARPAGAALAGKRVPTLHFEAKTDAGAPFEVAEIHISQPGGYFSGISEDGHVEHGGRVPAMLDREDDRLVVVEAIPLKTTEVIVATEFRLQVEGDEQGFLRPRK